MAKRKAVAEVAPAAVEVEAQMASVEVRNCAVCGKSIRSADAWCDQCQSENPVQWAEYSAVGAQTTLAADEQARMDAAIGVALNQVFGRPPSPPKLTRAAGYRVEI